MEIEVSAAQGGTGKSEEDKPLTVDTAKQLLMHQQQTNPEAISAPALSLVLADIDGSREKITKLKSLLGRSAKAQRESKVELEVTQKRLDSAQREIEKLQQQLQHLQTRPTHMELLADFSTNFDRALLAVDKPSPQHQQQSGGQETKAPEPAAPVVDKLLMQELSEAKNRIDKLTLLQSNLTQRSSNLETRLSVVTKERDESQQTVQRLELEKRMAELQAQTAVQEKERQASLCEEMQMEIDLVTKSSDRAHRKAAAEHKMLESAQSEKAAVDTLQSQVQALQEWALASAEAKRLAQERVQVLEDQLRRRQQGPGTDTVGRVLVKQTGSFVLGAGEVGFRVFQLTLEQVKDVRLSERVVLKWKFDLAALDGDIPFRMLRGKNETARDRNRADTLLPKRTVKGGAAGDTENAFTVDRACTLEWDNSAAWIRPKTVKFDVQVVVMADDS